MRCSIWSNITMVSYILFPTLKKSAKKRSNTNPDLMPQLPPAKGCYYRAEELCKLLHVLEHNQMLHCPDEWSHNLWCSPRNVFCSLCQHIWQLYRPWGHLGCGHVLRFSNGKFLVLIYSFHRNNNEIILHKYVRWGFLCPSMELPPLFSVSGESTSMISDAVHLVPAICPMGSGILS